MPPRFAMSPRRRDAPLRTTTIVVMLLLFAMAAPRIVSGRGQASDAPSTGHSRGLQVALDRGLGELRGRAGAFGDFDSDTYTDIFWIDEQQTRVSVMLWDRATNSFVPLASAVATLPPEDASGAVVSLAAADFNRDGRVDLLVSFTRSTAQGGGAGATLLVVYLGNGASFAPPLRIPGPATILPVVVEADGDLRPDLFGMANVAPPSGGGAKSNRRAFWMNRMPTHRDCGNGRQDKGEEGVDCGGDACLPCDCFGADSAGGGDSSGDSGSEGADARCGFSLRAASDMEGWPPLSSSRAASFADMDGDCLADIIAPNDQDEVEVWANRAAIAGSPRFQSPDPATQVLTLAPGAGSPTVGDFDRDGGMDILWVQSSGWCGGSPGGRGTCKSEILAAFSRKAGGWSSGCNLVGSGVGVTYGVPAGSKRGGVILAGDNAFLGESLIPPGTPVLPASGGNPALFAEGFGGDALMARAGDFDKDGFLDVVLTLRAFGGGTRVRLWRNVVDVDDGRGRTLEKAACESPMYQGGGGACGIAELEKLEGGYAAAFMDLSERGGLDILVLFRDGGGHKAKVVASLADAGNTFVKATALNGACWGWCDVGSAVPEANPFGGGQPGAVWKYRFQDLDGAFHQMVHAQMSATTHLRLEASHVVMGLGARSYFIEEIHMAVPARAALRGLHYTTVQGTIPNSRLIASPIGADPLKWPVQVYVRPSQDVQTIAVVLGTTLLVLAASIHALQRREKYQDAMEKQLTAHAFL